MIVRWVLAFNDASKHQFLEVDHRLMKVGVEFGELLLRVGHGISACISDKGCCNRSRRRQIPTQNIAL